MSADGSNIIPFVGRPYTPMRPPLSDEAFTATQNLSNPEAEQALLGAMLVNNSAYEAASEILQSDDWSIAVHQRLYAAIGSQIAAGAVATAVSLIHFFKGDPLLDPVGGSAAYLASLAGGAVSVLNAKFYAETIHDLALRRRLVETTDAIRTETLEAPDPERGFSAMLDDAEQALFQLGADLSQKTGTPQTIAKVIDDTLAQVEDAYKRAGDGRAAPDLDIGLLDVDAILRGIGVGDLVVLGGRPSMGKSALAITIALNVASASRRVLLFSLEMTNEQQAQRWIAAETGITTDKQRHGTIEPGDWPALLDTREKLAPLPIHLDDQPRLSVSQIRQRSRRLKRQYGDLGLIVIDHLQLIRQGGRQESRRVEIGDITSSLKALAKELEAPILLLSQIGRQVEQREDKRPALADLKESGDTEQDADIVLLLYREFYYLDRKGAPKRRPKESIDEHIGRERDYFAALNKCRNLAEINIAKNRLGQTGTAKVRFEAARQLFENYYEESC